MKTPHEQGIEEYNRAKEMFGNSCSLTLGGYEDALKKYRKSQTFSSRMEMEICRAIYEAKCAAFNHFCDNENLWPYRPE